MALNDFQNMERSTGFSVQRNAFDIGIRVILPFFFRNFLLLLFLFPEGYVGVKHQKPLPGKTGNGFLQRKRMRWEGKPFLSVSFAKHLLNLLMEFFKFFSHSSPCGHVINGGIMALVWSGVDGGWEGRGCTGSGGA